MQTMTIHNYHSHNYSFITAPSKRKKNNDGVVSNMLAPRPQQKNTVAILNELRQGLIYKLESQTGPVHAPIFRMSVVVRICSKTIIPDRPIFVAISCSIIMYTIVHSIVCRWMVKNILVKERVKKLLVLKPQVRHYEVSFSLKMGQRRHQ